MSDSAATQMRRTSAVAPAVGPELGPAATKRVADTVREAHFETKRERVCVCVPSMVHHLIMMKGLKCTNEPQSYVNWNLVFLVA